MASDDAIHANRRKPAQPNAPLDLQAAGRDLLEIAKGQAAKRSARTLTPGEGAPLKQTLLAICEGHELKEHPTPGPSTIQVLEGDVTITAGDKTLALSAGQWFVVPSARHDLVAHTDAVALLTVVARPA